MWYQRRLYYVALLGNLKAFMVLVAGVVAAPRLYAPAFTPSVATTAPRPETREGGDDAAAAAEVERAGAKRFASFARHTMERHCGLILELAILKAKGVGDSPQAREWLEAKGLLEGGEWSRSVPGQRQLSAVSWLASSVRPRNTRDTTCVSTCVLRQKHTLTAFDLQ